MICPGGGRGWLAGRWGHNLESVYINKTSRLPLYYSKPHFCKLHHPRLTFRRQDTARSTMTNLAR